MVIMFIGGGYRFTMGVNVAECVNNAIANEWVDCADELNTRGDIKFHNISEEPFKVTVRIKEPEYTIEDSDKVKHLISLCK